MISLAVQYAALDAPFLFVVQIIVYTGAILMLFLFVLMLVGVDIAESLVETIKGQRPLALLAGLGFGSLLVFAVDAAISVPPSGWMMPTRPTEQHPRYCRTALRSLCLRLRGHLGAAHHRRGRSHGAVPSRAAVQTPYPI